MVTDCSIKTHEAQETLDFEFYGTNVVNKIILKVVVQTQYHLDKYYYRQNVYEKLSMI